MSGNRSNMPLSRISSISAASGNMPRPFCSTWPGRDNPEPHKILRNDMKAAASAWQASQRPCRQPVVRVAHLDGPQKYVRIDQQESP